MNITELQERNYAAQIKRGKITDKTTVEDCIDDLASEVLELFEESPGTAKFIEEASDVMLNLLSVCRKAGVYGSDLWEACISKCICNEIRTD